MFCLYAISVDVQRGDRGYDGDNEDNEEEPIRGLGDIDPE